MGIVWSPATYVTGTRIAVGSSSSDMNQIINEYNLKATNDSLPTVTAWSTGARMTAAWFSDMQTKINTLRAADGESAFSFTSIASADRLTAAIIEELRQALDYTQLLPFTIAPTAWVEWNQETNPWPTNVSGWTSTTSGAPTAGKLGNTLTYTRRCRAILSFDLSTVAAVGNIRFQFDATVSIWEAFNFALYAVGSTSDYANGSNFLGSKAAAAGTNQSISLDNSKLTAGATNYILCVSDLEFSNGGADIAPARAVEYITVGGTSPCLIRP